MSKQSSRDELVARAVREENGPVPRKIPGTINIVVYDDTERAPLPERPPSRRAWASARTTSST